MHWAEGIAEKLLRQHPGRELFNFASGITPSGSVHVGNLRDIVTNYAISRCLQEKGKQVRLIHSWDDFDRFRKVPKQVPAEYAQYLGKPLIRIPDPFGREESYAAHFEKEFEKSLQDLGIVCDFRYQGQMYSSGVYKEHIIRAMQFRQEIFDIINSYKTVKGGEDERNQYYPIEIYCRQCNYDGTDVTAYDEATHSVSYTCHKCSTTETISLLNATNVKLPWKIDWAMRWSFEDVVFEPGGKDHGTAGGSFEVSSKIAETVYSRKPPMFQMYEFIGLKGVGKMSGSTGELLTLANALQIYQPEVLLWIFMRFPPTKAFDLPLDKQIMQIYEEFDRAYKKAMENPDAPEHKTIKLSLVPGRKLHPVPFNQIVSFVDVVGGNVTALEKIFEKIDTPHRQEEFSERLDKAKHWLETYAPEERTVLLPAINAAFIKGLSPVEHEWVASLHDWLQSTDFTASELSGKLYSIPAPPGGKDPAASKRFFQILYYLLFGKNEGPRLATFLSAVSKSEYLHLLDVNSVAAYSQ